MGEGSAPEGLPSARILTYCVRLGQALTQIKDDRAEPVTVLIRREPASGSSAIREEVGSMIAAGDVRPLAAQIISLGPGAPSQGDDPARPP